MVPGFFSFALNTVFSKIVFKIIQLLQLFLLFDFCISSTLAFFPVRYTSQQTLELLAGPGAVAVVLTKYTS